MRVFILVTLLPLLGTSCAPDTVTTPFTLLADQSEERWTGRLTFDAPPEPGVEVSGVYWLERAWAFGLPESGAIEASCMVDPSGVDTLVVSMGLGIADGGMSLMGRCVDGLHGGAWYTGSIQGSVYGGTFTFE